MMNLTKEQVKALQIWHDAFGYDCAAHGEGLTCCIDYLLLEYEDKIGEVPEPG